MSDRYYSPEPVSDDRATLRGDEARHLARVMRAKPGDSAIVFDGSGAEFDCQVAEVRKDVVELAVLSRRAIDRELPFQLTIAAALPKGERQRWLIEKLTELGVTRFQPLRTERGVAQPGEAALMRLRRTVIETSKQCGRNALMDVVPSRTWREFAASPSQNASDVLPSRPLVLLADPRAELSLAEFLNTDQVAAHDEVGASEVVVSVGPEGGFSPRELELAQSHAWTAVNLGPRTFRVETAAVALAAVLANGAQPFAD